MISPTLIQIRQQIEQINQIQDKLDPVNIVLKNLSSNPDWTVVLQSDESALINSPEKRSVKIKSDELNNSEESKVLNLASNKRSPNFPSYSQKKLLTKLKSIPIYAVVNNLNEVIISSPREENRNDTVDYLRKLQNEFFFWSRDNGSVSILLFFMNKEDAGSYLHEVCRRDPKEAEKLGLSIKKIGLDTFYKFNRISPPKVQAKLIGNLKEVDLIIKTIDRYRDKHIHVKQRYSKVWFQGVPVYKLKINKASNPKRLIEYQIKNAETEKTYVFFSQEDAEKAWKIYIERNKDINIHTKPNLEVYNLENLLTDLETLESEQLKNIILVPPYEKSRESKLAEISNFSVEYSEQTHLIYSLKLKLEEVKRLYKGLLWLITSDTLPSEENSW